MLELIDKDRTQETRIYFSGGYSVAAQSECQSVTSYGENLLGISHRA